MSEHETAGAAAARSLRDIVAVWKVLATDADSSIRWFTLLATIVGFSFVIFFLVATLDLSATLNGNHSFNPNKYIHCVVGELAVLGLFAIPAASRFSSRAQVGILDAKFAEIERVRRRPKRQKR